MHPVHEMMKLPAPSASYIYSKQEIYNNSKHHGRRLKAGSLKNGEGKLITESIAEGNTPVVLVSTR